MNGWRSVRQGWPAVLLLLLATVAHSEVPGYDDVREAYRSSYAELLDREGELLTRHRIDQSVNRLEWTPIDRVSPALQEAVLFAEDRRFYEHSGVDWFATLRAAANLARGDRSRGASTISMQLAALLDEQLRWQGGGRSLSQKWRQMGMARQLEAHWSKSQLLEAYLNLLTYRGDLQGIASVSHALFRKHPSGLTRSESLLVAALLPAPSASVGRVVQHGCALIAAGYKGVTCSELGEVAREVLGRRKVEVLEDPALAAVAGRLLQKPGERYRSSISSRIQRYATEVLRAQLGELAGQSVDAGAVLVLDNRSGEVVAYVANAAMVEETRYFDAIQAPRLAGSTLKPFLYQQAIERRLLTAASILEDSPVNIATPVGVYAPQNYERDFKGPVTVRAALASSLNVPAVRALSIVGLEDFWMRLQELGFSTLNENAGFYGFALALGSADVTLWSLTNAYRALANDGKYSEAGFDPDRNVRERQVMSPQASWIIRDILADRGARSLTFGLENPLATPFPTSVKTGTSKDMRDNWAVGFSSRYTVGVWVGNFDGAPMKDVSGVTGAAPVWQAVMQFLEGGKVRLDEQAPSPPGVEQHHTIFRGISEPSRKEWYISGTGMDVVYYAPDSVARIRYPANETLMALDPDIPQGHQSVRFAADTGGHDVVWVLNGKRIGAGAAFDWPIQAGNWRLELKNAQGRVEDAVVFTVRGRRSRAQ